MKGFSLRLLKIIHSNFYIEFGNGRTVLIDPFFCRNLPEGFKCEEELGKELDELPKVDAILITHEHFDHFDREAVEKIVERYRSVVVAPKNIMIELNVPDYLKRPVHVDDELKVVNLNVKVLPCQHPLSFYPVSYLIDDGKTKVYHAGDASNLPSVKFDADVALMPAGGKFTADLHVFISMARRLAPKVAIPMHYNTFKSIKLDVDRLKEKAKEKLKETKLVVLDNGQEFIF